MAESKLDFKTSIRKVFYEPQSSTNAVKNNKCSENLFEEQFSNEVSDSRINYVEQKITEQNKSIVNRVASVAEGLGSLHFDDSSSVSSETLFIRECKALRNFSSSPSLYSNKFSGGAPPTWNKVFKNILGNEQTISEVEMKVPGTESSFEDTIFHGLARGRVTGPDSRYDIENQSFHENHCLSRTRGPCFGQRNNFRGQRRRSFARFHQRNSIKEDNCSNNQSSSKGFQFSQKNCFKEGDSSWKQQSSARARGLQKRQSYGSSSRIWRGKKDHSSKYLTDEEYEEIRNIERTLRAAQTFKLPKSTLTLNDFDGAGVNCFGKEFQMPPVLPKKPPKQSFKYEVHGRIYYFQSDSDEELDYDTKLKPNVDANHESKKGVYFTKQEESSPTEPAEYWDDDPVIMNKS